MQNSSSPFSPPSGGKQPVLSPQHSLKSPLLPLSPPTHRNGYRFESQKKNSTNRHEWEITEKKSLLAERRERNYSSDSSSTNTEEKESQTLWSIPLDATLPTDIISTDTNTDHIDRHVHKKFRHRRKFTQISGDSDTQDEDMHHVSSQKLPRCLPTVQDHQQSSAKTVNSRQENGYARASNENKSRIALFDPWSPVSNDRFSEPKTSLNFDPRTPGSESRTPFCEPRTPYSDPSTPYSDPWTPRSDPQTPHSDPWTPYSGPRTPFSDPRTPYSDPRTPYSDPRTPYSDPRTPYSEHRTSFSDPQTPSFSEPRTPYSDPPTPHSNLPTPSSETQTQDGNLRTRYGELLTGTPSGGPRTSYSEHETLHRGSKIHCAVPRIVCGDRPQTHCSDPKININSHTPPKSAGQRNGPQMRYGGEVHSPFAAVRSVEPHSPQSLEPPESVGSQVNSLELAKNSSEVEVNYDDTDIDKPVIDLRMPKFVDSCEPKTPCPEPRIPYVEPNTPYSVEPGSQIVSVNESDFDSGYSCRTDVSDHKMAKCDTALIPRETFLANNKCDGKGMIDLSNKRNSDVLEEGCDVAGVVDQNPKGNAFIQERSGSHEMLTMLGPTQKSEKVGIDLSRGQPPGECPSLGASGKEYYHSVGRESLQPRYMTGDEQQRDRSQQNHFQNLAKVRSPNESQCTSTWQCNGQKSGKNMSSPRSCSKQSMVHKSFDESARSLDGVPKFDSVRVQPNALANSGSYSYSHSTREGENVELTDGKTSEHQMPESQSRETDQPRSLVIDAEMVLNSGSRTEDSICQLESTMHSCTGTKCVQASHVEVNTEESPCARDGQVSQGEVMNSQKQGSEPAVQSQLFVAPQLEPWGYDPQQCNRNAAGYFNGHYYPLGNNCDELYPSTFSIPRFTHPALPSLPLSQANSVDEQPQNTNENCREQISQNLQSCDGGSEKYQYSNELPWGVTHEKQNLGPLSQSPCLVSGSNSNSIDGDACVSLDSSDSNASGKQRKHTSSIDSNLESSPRTKSKCTTYQKEIRKVLCKVCGDTSSGFHCGAYVCEACKKFFIRSMKHSSVKYVCSKNKTCRITKESRTQCQYCRYQKCLSSGMMKPGTDPLSSINGDISNIPCKVCGAPSSGFHFGAITCEGCKGFFRRTIKERDSYRYACSKGGNCSITLSTRNACKYCRFKQCIDVGMTPDGSRIGRQPNSVKHATRLELKQIHGNHTQPKSKGPPALIRNSCPSTPPLPKLTTNLPTMSPLQVDVKKEPGVLSEAEMDSYEGAILRALKDLVQIRRKPYNMPKMTDFSPLAMWSVMMEQFNHDALCALKFAKKIPGFRKLSISDQITLVQTSIYQLCLFMHVELYDPVNQKINYFNFSDEELVAIMQTFPNFSVFADHFLYFGETFQELELDEIEYGFLSAIQLMSSDEGGLKGTVMIDEIQENLSLTLQHYIEKKEGPNSNRFGFLLLRLTELRMASLNHQQVIINLKKKMPELPFPQLFTEMFLNNVDEAVEREMNS